jgi:hypothetical protein
VTDPARPRLHVLGSYHYLKRAELTADLRAIPAEVDFFADSGGFSAFASGAVVRVEDYAAWLVRHASVINAAATLDVIGDPVASAVNTRRLIELTDGTVPIAPIFHVGSPWKVLEKLCAEHPYVGLGGGVAIGNRQEAMTRWMVRAHQIARDHNARFHGFGMTKPPYPELLPWYSVDSSYWTSASRTGSLSLWDGRQFQTFRVGGPTAAKHALLIRRYGGNPARAVRPGFGIVRETGPVARIDARWMGMASILSWRRYEESIRARRDVVPPPRAGRTTGDGIKVYLAVGNTGDAATIHRALTVPPADWESLLAAQVAS